MLNSNSKSNTQKPIWAWSAFAQQMGWMKKKWKKQTKWYVWRCRRGEGPVDEGQTTSEEGRRRCPEGTKVDERRRRPMTRTGRSGWSGLEPDPMGWRPEPGAWQGLASAGWRQPAWLAGTACQRLSVWPSGYRLACRSACWPAWR